MRQHEGLTIVEALENLNILSDIESLDEIEVSENAVIISHKSEHEGTSKKGKETYWLHAGPDDQTLRAVKETFKSVYEYLQSSYEKMKKEGSSKRLIEGMSTIMVLVGETAKKLERFGTIFQKVTELNEYKKLEHFYRNKVIKESYKEFMRMPIPESVEDIAEVISLEEELAELLPVEEKGVFPLNDIDVVKKDTHYELFYLKNEDGRNFYTYDLARNIKLACDFGEFQEEYFGQDPLLQVKNWIDKNLQLLAANILKYAKKEIDKFYKEAMRYKNLSVVEILSKALMALMLASYPKNLIRQFSTKGCYSYFADFQLFLREAILSREYQKLIIFSAPTTQSFFVNLVEVVEKLSKGLFILGGGKEEILKVLKELNNRERDKKKIDEQSLSAFLRQRFDVINNALKKHPSGPIFKAVDLVREEEERLFDPLLQENLPEPEYIFKRNGKETRLIRMPAPVLQEYINQANVALEFKEFLRSLQRGTAHQHHLIINLQDRTSWKEHARCLCLEEISRNAQFDRSLTVITLAKETDFYKQEGELYEELNDAQEFILQFFSHIEDDASGYYYSPKIRKVLFPYFVKEVIKNVHVHFFDEKKTLSLHERQAFIDLCYLLIELKVLEVIDPDTFSFVSKDGLDRTAISNVAFIALVALNEKEPIEEGMKNELERILFASTLLLRERAIFEDSFERFYRLLAILEQKATKKGALLQPFASLFDEKTLNIKGKILGNHEKE